MSRSVIAAAVAGLVVLTACGSPTQPSAPPTSEDALTTATSEPDVVEVTSEEPEETSEAPEMDQTEAGAEAFVEHYFVELNKARETGKTEDLQELAAPQCKSCANFSNRAAKGGLPPLEAALHESVVAGDTAVVTVDVTDDGQSGRAYLDLEWEGGWRVVSVKAEG